MFNSSGTSCLTEKTGAHEGDFETESDLAQARYYKAIESVDRADRGLIRFVCLEASPDQTAGIFACASMIQHGLDRLKKHFMGEGR